MKKTTCAIFLLNQSKTHYLVCKPTKVEGLSFGNYCYDLPKGIQEIYSNNETENHDYAKQTAIRELQEETGLIILNDDNLIDLHKTPYNKEKDLHIFFYYDKDNTLLNDLNQLHCDSYFEHNQVSYPEVCGYELLSIQDLFLNKQQGFCKSMEKALNKKINQIKELCQ